MNKFKKGKILDVQRSKKISIIMEKSISKNTLNHHKQIWTIFAESFTYTSEKLFPSLLHFWLFSTNHGSCATSWNPGPLSLAAMFPYTRPQLCSMEFLFRVAILHARMETTGSSLLSSLVHSLHTFTEQLCSKSVTNKPSS